MKLWYQQPANSWVEALPIGNGRLGAMIFGNTEHEVISLNEDTLWSGYPRDLNPRGKSECFHKAVELTKQMKYHEAQSLIEEQLTSGWGQSYLPLGDLKLDFRCGGKIENYVRELNISSAIASVEYSADGVKYKRELFASAPDNVIAIKISADRPKSINFSMTFECQLRSTVSVKNGILLLKGEAPSHVEPSYSNALDNPVVYSEKDEERGMLFAAMAGIKATGGIIRQGTSELIVENANEVIVFISAQTSFAGYDVRPFLNGKNFEDICINDLNEALTKSYYSIRMDHIADYKSHYDRVELELGNIEASNLPTDERLRCFQEQHDDFALYTLLFQYGRYLLISSSRKGTQPANLQGIWNDELRPPWSSNYTININTQMNYWPAFSCGLGELQEPLVKMIKDISVKGRATAREVYGARGFTAHHNTDLWRFTSPVGNKCTGSACYAFWNASSGWLCRHLYDQYEYTLDREFLRSTAYPIMKGAAEFYLDIMSEGKGGYLIICPSTSPENAFLYEGKRCNISATATMTMAVVRELFKNCIMACEILGCDNCFAEELKEKLSRLYPYKIGSRGQLLEWYEEYEELELHHRHISHLYGLYPGNEISIEGTPELAEACRRSLDIRGDDGTGWSLGWKINQWARLKDGDRALKLLNMQLRVATDTGTDYTNGGGTYINLFDAHPPFQIDGNFGATSGISEMLLQSRDNKISLLPALPSTWKKGYVKGLCAKGRVLVNIYWDDNATKAELLSEIDQTIMVDVKGTKLVKVKLMAGHMLTI